MPRLQTECSSAAAIPAGTSTELVRNGSPAMTSADGDVTDRCGGRVCGAANG